MDPHAHILGIVEAIQIIALAAQKSSFQSFQGKVGQLLISIHVYTYSHMCNGCLKHLPVKMEDRHVLNVFIVNIYTSHLLPKGFYTYMQGNNTPACIVKSLIYSCSKTGPYMSVLLRVLSNLKARSYHCPTHAQNNNFKSKRGKLLPISNTHAVCV